jgi:hypothetical protein
MRIFVAMNNKVLEYYEQALKISKETDYKRGIESYLRNMGLAYVEIWEHIKATEYCVQGLKIAKDIGYRRREALRFKHLEMAYIIMCKH